MKNYSEFTNKYVKDICDAINEIGFKMPMAKTEFAPEYFKTLTELLEDYVTYSLDIYNLLNNKGLVNRGFCPFTGEKIDTTFPNYAYMGRKVYVSHQGYSIMKGESDAKYEEVMGRPPSNKSANQGNGCYIATVCYQNEYAFEVISLKNYRDTVLQNSFVGRLFVKFYYTVSPFLAKRMTNTIRLNRFIKQQVLDKIVKK